jgi:hypothetical protein
VQARTFDTRNKLFESMQMVDNLDPTPLKPRPIDYTKLDTCEDDANVPESTGKFNMRDLPRMLEEVKYVM